MTSSLNKLTSIKSHSLLILFGVKTLLIFFTLGCSSSKEDNLNTQSIEIHNLALKKGEEMEDKLQKIKQFSSETKSALQPAFLDSINALQEDFHNWKSNIVEVPGHEHDHHDHHDHEGHDHHHHEPDPELTPQMVLEIQQFILAEIEKLNVRAEQLNKALQSSFSSEN